MRDINTLMNESADIEGLVQQSGPNSAGQCTFGQRRYVNMSNLNDSLHGQIYVVPAVYSRLAHVRHLTGK